MSVENRVTSSLARISKEETLRDDPFLEVAQEHLEELSETVLDEYPFIRSVYPVGCCTPSHILVGTLAGTADGSKVLTDGALNTEVFKRHPQAVMYSKSSKGWSFRLFLLPFTMDAKLRFWIHVSGGGKKGDHPGSRQFYMMGEKEVKRVSKEEYERA